ncbi:MAG TPA: LCP family protein [Candidatus Saccharimonadales bacterium]|nr:LCP family protein [Candidatus Saccharimonadales bacterium]
MRKPKKTRPVRSTDSDVVEYMYRTIPAGMGRDRGQRRGVTAGKGKAAKPIGGEKPSRWKRAVKHLLILCAVILLLAGIWVGWKFASNAIKIFGWKGLTEALKPAKLDGEDQGRVTILLAGNSADDPGHSGAELTDSIMIVSINTATNTGYLLSIPRDLYVAIPGYSYGKINEVYQNGKQTGFSEAGYAAAGMGLLEKVVSQNFGVKIHYYALVNYTALQQAVDAVGGIQIIVDSSDPRGLYDPSRDLATGSPLVDLPNGKVYLNGRNALNLARARGQGAGSYGFPRSDFDRTKYQRQILIGLKDRAISAGTLSNPIKLGELFDAMGSNVDTDLELNEVRRAYELAGKIPSSSLVSASLSEANGKNLLQSYRTPSGQSALIPALGVDDFTDIRAYVGSLP